MRFVLNLIVVIAVGLSCATACSKKSSDPFDPHGLTGSWKLVRSGGNGVLGPIPYTGLPKVLQLQTEGMYSRRYNDVLSESGYYSMTRNNAGDRVDTVVTFTSQDTMYYKHYISSGTELLLIEVVNPGVQPFEEIFQKIQ